MNSVTENVREYVQSKGVSLKRISEVTGIPYNAIWLSLGNYESRNRDLRADEFLDICDFLEVDPRKFSVKREKVEV